MNQPSFFFKQFLLGILITFSHFVAFGQQPVNGYAKVTSISGTTINLSNVDETYDTFEAGEKLILQQVQDDVIGTTSNTSGFGSLGSIQSAGLYEQLTIASITESGGVPTSITVVGPLDNSYNTCLNCSVQIISYPELNDGSGDFTTTTDIVAMDWNGNIGGVVAFRVPNTLHLNHDVSADGSGFRGGDPNPTPDGGGCQGGTYTTNSNNYSFKGEGIYKSTDANYDHARGRILNGGGGGNPHNSGGGGGGNYTSGGNAGPGWNCGGSPANGIGGLDLSAQITGTRVFMGGGGGGGHQNNSVSNGGGSGGGIIFIKAKTVQAASCSGLAISANGESIGLAGNDGAGGGGAGGSIVVNVSNWSLGCTLDVSANGGNGGSVNDGGQHGGGGGGGKGALLFTTTISGISNLNTSNTQGTGGANQTGASPTVADNGSSSPSYPMADPDGVLESESVPLPVQLLFWEGEFEGSEVVLNWATASETNNQFFTIERSNDMEHWTHVAYVEGHGTTKYRVDYDLTIPNVSFTSQYFRLTQTDFDGTQEEFKSIYLHREDHNLDSPILFPNPTSDEFRVTVDNSEKAKVRVLDLQGKEQDIRFTNTSNGLVGNVSTIDQGIYLVEIRVREQVWHYRLKKKG